MKKIIGFVLVLILIASAVFAGGFTSGGGRTGGITNNGQDVNIQDQHTRALDLKFIIATAPPTTLALDTVVDSRELTLTSAINFIDGTHVVIAEAGDNFYTADQIGVSVGNVITMDTPLDRVYPAGTIVLHTSYNMAVDGSLNPQVFQVGSAESDVEMDITRILGFLQDDLDMDDGLFGGLPALTNGCVFRLSNGVKQNLWNVKSNGDIALIGYDFSYSEKAKFGSYGARFRVTYASAGKHGVTLRLEAGEFLEFIIQDDLTGLEVFNVMAQGHIVE